MFYTCTVLAGLENILRKSRKTVRAFGTYFSYNLSLRTCYKHDGLLYVQTTASLN